MDDDKIEVEEWYESPWAHIAGMIFGVPLILWLIVILTYVVFGTGVMNFLAWCLLLVGSCISIWFGAVKGYNQLGGDDAVNELLSKFDDFLGKK